jgi:hypothetical protein
MKWLDAESKLVFRTWSLWLTAIGTALLSALTMFPEWALVIWAQLPQEFKSAIPARYMPMVSVIFFVMAMIAKFVKQQKLDRERQLLALKTAETATLAKALNDKIAETQ